MERAHEPAHDAPPHWGRRQAARGMRRVRRLERARRGRGHRAGPARPAASRPGSHRHRQLRRQPFPLAQGPGPGRRQFQRRPRDRLAARPIAVGHNRYATTGDTILRNVQPLYADFEFGGFAVAHNGNLTNAHVLRRALVRRGCLFQSTTDSEVFVHLIAISLYSTVVDRLIDALKQVVGAYSLVALSNEALMGVRDPLGVRPLILGRIGNAGHRRLGAGVRDLRAGDRRRRVRPRRRARRDRGDQRPGRAQHQAIRPRPRAVLRVRIHLFRPARFGGRGHARL